MMGKRQGKLHEGEPKIAPDKNLLPHCHTRARAAARGHTAHHLRSRSACDRKILAMSSQWILQNCLGQYGDFCRTKLSLAGLLQSPHC